MNTNPFRPSRSEIARKFAVYRRNMRLGAVAMVSLSTLRALSAVEQRQADRLTRSIVSQGQTVDTITDEDTAPIAEREESTGHAARSFSLSPFERAAIDAARPGSRAVVWLKSPVAATEADEPLPSDFIPAPVAPFESAFLPLTDEIKALELAAAIEAGIEVTAIEAWDRDTAAASAFVSDYASAPTDYPPGVAKVAAPTPVAVAPLTEAESLLASVLANAKPRRITFRA